ncbi:MAG: hypothetical protein NUV31_03530, partial [Dehalococcoidales bacterium]|nr:hypothetical protein [Dehalococcoidales bacterium]
LNSEAYRERQVLLRDVSGLLQISVALDILEIALESEPLGSLLSNDRIFFSSRIIFSPEDSISSILRKHLHFLPYFNKICSLFDVGPALFPDFIDNAWLDFIFLILLPLLG